MNRIEVITSVERRRRWGRAEKERLVAAMTAPGASVAEIARKEGVDPSLLYRWRRQLVAPSEVLSFVSLTAAPAAPEAGACEAEPAAIMIEFGADVRMKIPGAPDAETLARTIGALLQAGRRR
jgi:transposase